MNLPWFRLYAEFGTDPIIQSLAFEDQRHYIILLCLKASGVLDRSISSASRERIILRGLGLDSVSGHEVKRRLMEVKLITNCWQICGWEKRQCQSDSSTERSRKHRKSKGGGNVPATSEQRPRNVPATDQNRTDQIIAKSIYNPLNPPLAEISSATLPAAPPEGTPGFGKNGCVDNSIPGLNSSAFAEWDCERRRRGGKSKASWSDTAKLKSANLLACESAEDQQAMVDASIANGWQGLFPPRNAKSPVSHSAKMGEYMLDKVRRRYEQKD